MTIKEIIIPYPDFIMGEVIDPEQFNLNNDYLIRKSNEILSTVNHMTDGKDGSSGADILSITPVAPLVSKTLQSTLVELIAFLSTGEKDKGADFIKTMPIKGVNGSSVSGQLSSLKSILDAISLDIESKVKRDIYNLQINKAERIEFYDRSTVDAKLNGKVDVKGDFTGTWHGMSPSDAASETINGGRLDVMEPKIAYLLSVVQTLDMVKRELANIKLYQDANDRVKNGILFGTKFDDTFGMEIDFTKSHTTSVVSTGDVSIEIDNPAGFVTGSEVTLYDDENYETVTITAFNGNTISITPTVNNYKVGAGFARTMAVLDDVALQLDFATWEGIPLLMSDVRFKLELPFSSLAVFVTHGDGMAFSGGVDGVDFVDKTLEGVVNVSISEVV